MALIHCRKSYASTMIIPCLPVEGRMATFVSGRCGFGSLGKRNVSSSKVRIVRN